MRESTEVELLEEERMSGGITGNDGLESAEDGSLNVDPLLLLPSFPSAIAKILDIGGVKLLQQLGTDEIWKSLSVIIQKDDIPDHIVIVGPARALGHTTMASSSMRMGAWASIS